MLKWIEAAKLSDLAPTGRKVVYIEGERILITQIGDFIFAVSDICSHAEAFLSEGEIKDTKVICPLHGSEFDLQTGAALTMPAVTPIATYPVKLDGDTLLLQFDV